MKFLSIGSDPEVFVEDHQGEIVTAIGKVGGTKKKPKPLRIPGYYVQEDNVLAEFNIPPQETKGEFVKAIHQGKDLITEVLPENHKVKIKTSHKMPEKELQHRKAKAFGCDPDICAWDGGTRVADPPIDGLRTAGGHVYVGYENPDEATNIKLAKALDITLGVPSVLMDNDKERRTLYGQAGAFRHKPFGLEYRTLSSFWIADTPLIEWVYDGVQKAIKLVESGVIDALDDADQSYIQTAINYSNLDCVEKIMKDFDIKLP